MTIEVSSNIIRSAIDDLSPDYIVSMVSGGKDSACSHAVAVETLEDMGRKVDLIIHGNTRCGIPETSQFVQEHYGTGSIDYAVADAGTAYEDYVLRKGFFGRGYDAHAYAYRILKAGPFRKVVSAKLRQRRRGVRVLLLNGARQDESENRRKNLQIRREDPAATNNIWVSNIFNWSERDRDDYLASRNIPINPVATQLCRSGECMCGTMQSPQERAEAAALYPGWGKWLADLEAEALALHGLKWGEPSSAWRNPAQQDLFQPMCSDCTKEGHEHE